MIYMPKKNKKKSSRKGRNRYKQMENFSIEMEMVSDKGKS